MYWNRARTLALAACGLPALLLMAPAAQAGGTPKIGLDKTGPTSAHQGETVTYGFAVENTGDVRLSDPVITDSKCESPITRDAGETDDSFDPGDTWHYSCTYTVPAG